MYCKPASLWSSPELVVLDECAGGLDGLWMSALQRKVQLLTARLSFWVLGNSNLQSCDIATRYINRRTFSRKADKLDIVLSWDWHFGFSGHGSGTTRFNSLGSCNLRGVLLHWKFQQEIQRLLSAPLNKWLVVLFKIVDRLEWAWFDYVYMSVRSTQLHTSCWDFGTGMNSTTNHLWSCAIHIRVQ